MSKNMCQKISRHGNVLKSTQENIEIETEEEPMLSQEALAKALMEHNQFLKAGERLNQRLVLNRDIWCCHGLSFTDKKEEEVVQSEDGLFSLFSAFKNRSNLISNSD